MTLDLFMATLCALFASLMIFSKRLIINIIGYLTFVIVLGLVLFHLGHQFLALILILTKMVALAVFSMFTIIFTNFTHVQDPSSKNKLFGTITIAVLFLATIFLTTVLALNDEYLAEAVKPNYNLMLFFESLLVNYALTIKLTVLLCFTLMVSIILVLKEKLK